VRSTSCSSFAWVWKTFFRKEWALLSRLAARTAIAGNVGLIIASTKTTGRRNKSWLEIFEFDTPVNYVNLNAKKQSVTGKIGFGVRRLVASIGKKEATTNYELSAYYCKKHGGRNNVDRVFRQRYAVFIKSIGERETTF